MEKELRHDPQALQRIAIIVILDQGNGKRESGHGRGMFSSFRENYACRRKGPTSFLFEYDFTAGSD